MLLSDAKQLTLYLTVSVDKDIEMVNDGFFLMIFLIS